MLRQLRGEVLDYGCGYGDLTYEVSRTHSVRGVDIDPSRIAFAESEYAPIPFSVCKPTRAPYDDSTFDIVTSIAVVPFVPDPREHLAEVRRLLRDKGHLLIACVNPPVLRDGVRRLFCKPKTAGRLWYCSRGEFRELLCETGFTVVAESHFYDPPFDGWKNLGGFAFGIFQTVLSLLRIRATADYYLFLAQKVQ
jgi:SAM-dependent methyltransferase